MSLRAPVEYSSVSSVRGPLLVVQGVEGVGWDEVARSASSPASRATASSSTSTATSPSSRCSRAPSRCGWGSCGSPSAAARCESRSARRGSAASATGAASRSTEARRSSPTTGPASPAARSTRARETPSEPILTGVSVVDGLATLVRGQKLPIFSVGGLPHLELAAQIAAQAHAGGEPFAVVFAAVGITHADAMAVRDVLEERSEQGDLALLLNTADDPLIERIVTPRIALTVAEHLAFDLGRHVLVVIADMTSYCEAVREVSAARGEIPSRRGYPGYLYSDLASLYERAGRIAGRPGSLTQVPVLTMPAGDITHPVPDLTGYITEGQLVLSPDLHVAGVYPPFDALRSLSRLMRLGAGPGRTRDDHLAVAAQLYAALARARQLTDLADVVGEAGLTSALSVRLAVARALEAPQPRPDHDRRATAGRPLPGRR